MNYDEFLTRIIDDGIEAARKDYKRPEQRAKLSGALEGFETCRDKNPEELSVLLKAAQRKTRIARSRVNEGEIGVDDYWRIRCCEAEIEWVCNVVSAMLVNQGTPPIITPTARGALKAAEILGVKGE